ncbi:MAG: peptide ABC transporter substrate-binding protein [Candidatus Eremiobacteraeota bacterium]|nr:peptide ABC transporter substrate-binding protein [Candidatus Eremiobacteraeota bacterium]
MFGLLVVFALASCARGAHDPNTLIIAQQHEPRSLNPGLENGTSSTEWGLLVFSYLLKFNDKGELIGDIATAVPSLNNGGISADGRTITYHLRNNVRFSDGVPLTARDAVFSINAILNPKNNVQSRYGYDRIMRAQAPNSTTLVLRLRKPFAPLLTLVEAPQGFPILPEHILKRFRDFNQSTFSTAPIGSGPYAVVHWRHGDEVALAANPHYWAGAPTIKSLVIRFVPDSNTAINLMRTGEADGFFDDQDMSDLPELTAIPHIRVTRTPVDAVGAIIFNTQDPLTADSRVRHALAMAIDVNSLVAKAYLGALDAKNAGRGLFMWAYDSAIARDRYDPAGARRLLDAAGWRSTPGGVRAKNGRTLDLQLILEAGTPGDSRIAAGIRQYEAAVGANVSLKAYNVTQFAAPAGQAGPVYSGKFQLALYPFVPGDDPDTTDQFSCARVPPNGYNKSRICDKAIDAMLLAGRTTYIRVQRKAIYARLQTRLQAELPLLLLYQLRQVNAFTTRLHGQTTSLSGPFWNVGAWSLQP